MQLSREVVNNSLDGPASSHYTTNHVVAYMTDAFSRDAADIDMARRWSDELLETDQFWAEEGDPDAGQQHRLIGETRELCERLLQSQTI